ncbi:zinc finger protein [Macleaya cordata]|uniref:RING-type E3 ubiquitin transferase n=1 Tax=Macleaya cordata TaxID=56857 RepID=A0A200QVK9_MACCD|nr:zinc finger protein [Macleaya cordata]
MADDENDRRLYPDQRVRFNLNGRIMITAIVCLFVVVVLVVLLHIYARYALRRQARRRAALRQFPMGGATGTTTTQLHSSEPPKRGLNQSVISSLPIFVYKQVDHLGDTDKIECSVCLSTLEDEEIARLLPNCKHTFHAECIDMWLNSHSTCPVCRTEAEPRVQPETRDHGSVVAVTAASAPSVDLINSTTTTTTVPCSEGTSDSAVQSAKVSGSSSRLSSFRRMLSRERSSRRIQLSEQTDVVGDIERQ